MAAVPKESVRRVFLWAVRLVLVAAVLLSFGGYEIFRLAKGPRPAGGLPMADLAGQYIGTDLWFVDGYGYAFSGMPEDAAEETGRQDSLDFLCVTAGQPPAAYGLRIPASELDAFWAEYNRYERQFADQNITAENLAVPMPRVSGTVAAMTEEEAEWFDEAASYFFYEGVDTAPFHYYIRVNDIGGYARDTVLLMGVGAGVLLLAAAVLALSVFCGRGTWKSRGRQPPSRIAGEREEP